MCCSKLPNDDPRIIAWENYKRSEEYANTKKWAINTEYTDGSLWKAFLAGYTSAQIGLNPPILDLVKRLHMDGHITDFEYQMILQKSLEQVL